MTILAGDIKLVASSVMADVPIGGGAPTSTVISDGVSNAVFPDISELDRAVGRVNMRKLHVHVQTSNVDQYLGANVIVADPPDDPLVSTTIFSNGAVFDTRAEASRRIESYLNAGPEWPGFLYEAHVTGQRSIQLCTRTNVATPPIGRTLLLRKDEGLGTEYEQYVRITRVESEERTFTDPMTGKDYQALIVTCDISDALRYDFPGTAANITFTRNSTATKTRDTTVVDAGSYHGVTPLDVAAAVGDVNIKVESVYTQLVPNARTETALADQVPSGETAHALASTPKLVTVAEAPFSQRVRIGQSNRSFNYSTIVTPLPAPGTVKVTYRALGVNYSITDNGDGTMSGSGTGTINYLTGTIVVTLQALPDDRSAVMFYWGQNSAYTNRSGQAGFRAPEYSFDLEHDNVEPNSLTITWTSGGNVKTATDNGTGKLTGDASGEIIYATGMVYIRPTNLMDAGGQFSIEYDWSSTVEEIKTGASPDLTGSIAFSFDQEPVPGTVVVEWLTVRDTSASSGATSASGSTNKSSMQRSDAGNTTSTQTAMVDTTKTYRKYTAEVANAYNMPKDQATIKLVPGDGVFPWNLQNPDYVVTTKVPVVTSTSHSTSGTGSSSTENGSTYSTASSQTAKNAITVAHMLTDDGAGKFFGTFGTLSYVGKTATLKVQGDYSETSYSSNYEQASSFETLNATSESVSTVGGGVAGGTSSSVSGGGGGSASARGGTNTAYAQKESFGANSLVVRYKTGSPTPSSHTETYTPPGVTIDLCPYTTDTIVPGSVRFTWMGHVYDDFEGRIYRGRTSSDPGILSGTVDYVAGQAAMMDYVVGGPATSFSLTSLWTRKPRGHIANVTFATPLAPLVPGGITISVLDVAGTQIIASANISGQITGTHTHGVVDFETGLVEIQFGDYVLDSGLTAEQKAEWWYNADDVRTADGKIWRPWPVDPETLRYTCTAYFYLPIDAGILGLDPVRLPQDGRVPIFRAGGLLVIGHTGTLAPQTVSNGQTVDCGRVRLSRVRVIGDNDAIINTGYTADLEAGTLTFDDTSGYSQPVTIEHRIEDMAMVAEVQINGRLRITRQLTHDYPVPGSYVSSALVIGDMQTYVSALFDQTTWTGVWSDAQIGATASGTYNATLAPILLTNIGAITERWYVQFTNTTSFVVAGEHVGVIATGNTSADCAPLNPATGEPYFTLQATGWGLGWATGNILRFNTQGSSYPVWVVRTIQQGPESLLSDEFTLLVRGDVDRP